MRATMTFELLNPGEHQELARLQNLSCHINRMCYFPFVAHGSQSIMQLRWIIFIEFDTM